MNAGLRLTASLVAGFAVGSAIGAGLGWPAVAGVMAGGLFAVACMAPPEVGR